MLVLLRHFPLAAAAALLAPSPRPRAPPAHANFFSQFMPKPQPSPADVYQPDCSVAPAGLPADYDEVYTAAAAGVAAALGREAAVEVDFPPLASANARGDGSAKSEQMVQMANAAFVRRLRESLVGSGRTVAVVGCTGGALSALGSGAVSLRAAESEAAGKDVAVCVAPFSEEQWDAAVALGTGATTVVVVNGLLSNGRLPHAYYYKPLSAFSVQTGGVVRRYPGAYECYDIRSPRAPLELEVVLITQGRRALPDTKDAQMALQAAFGRT